MYIKKDFGRLAKEIAEKNLSGLAIWDRIIDEQRAIQGQAVTELIRYAAIADNIVDIDELDL